MTTTRTISWLADAAGVPISTVRYYERQRVLAPPDRSASGYRHYADADLERLKLVWRAKQLGFSLAEIVELLGTGQQRSPEEVRTAARRKRSELERKVGELTSAINRLRHLDLVCDIGDPAQCTDLNIDTDTAAAPGHARDH